MKTNEAILDQFGELLIKEFFDNQFRFIDNSVSDLSETKEFENLFRNMSDVQKKEIEKYTFEKLKGGLFDFMRIFEENRQFKIVYEENREQVDLVKISEMLKAEPVIENGWIDRFSKFANRGY